MRDLIRVEDLIFRDMIKLGLPLVAAAATESESMSAAALLENAFQDVDRHLGQSETEVAFLPRQSHSLF